MKDRESKEKEAKDQYLSKKQKLELEYKTYYGDNITFYFKKVMNESEDTWNDAKTLSLEEWVEKFKGEIDTYRKKREAEIEEEENEKIAD